MTMMVIVFSAHHIVSHLVVQLLWDVPSYRLDQSHQPPFEQGWLWACWV